MALELFGVCNGARLEFLNAPLPEGEPPSEAGGLGRQHLEVRFPDFGFRGVIECRNPLLREIQKALLEGEQLRVDLGPMECVIDILGVFVLALEQALRFDRIQRCVLCFLMSWNRSRAAVVSVRIGLRVGLAHDTHFRVASASAAGGV